MTSKELINSSYKVSSYYPVEFCIPLDIWCPSCNFKYECGTKYQAFKGSNKKRFQKNGIYQLIDIYRIFCKSCNEPLIIKISEDPYMNKCNKVNVIQRDSIKVSELKSIHEGLNILKNLQDSREDNYKMNMIMRNNIRKKSKKTSTLCSYRETSSSYGDIFNISKKKK
ncbi:hypothetical protein cand_035630 [Cryptosporidium andersoni]|uniref:Splicing factor YJU2 n=1 Tax=Cryptosporidium andersoni TaxID=117008 RepID=A0A1J4MVB8_9CRYT|nr:hypothetical protein cand_035630 [Cryptosporidium andersoni]